MPASTRARRSVATPEHDAWWQIFWEVPERVDRTMLAGRVALLAGFALWGPGLMLRWLGGAIVLLALAWGGALLVRQSRQLG
jgi:hypothetical protein